MILSQEEHDALAAVVEASAETAELAEILRKVLPQVPEDVPVLRLQRPTPAYGLPAVRKASG
jgi:hypothetical protein